jgi:chromosomal replication initiator protein
MPRQASPSSSSRNTPSRPRRSSRPAASSSPVSAKNKVNNSPVSGEAENPWAQISSALRDELGQGVFDRWFSTAKLEALDAKALTLAVPNSIYQVWIESNYAAQVQAALLTVLGGKRKLKFVVSSGENFADTPAKEAPGNAEVEVEAEEKARDSYGLNPRYVFDSFVVGSNSEFAHAASLAVAKSPSRTYNPLFIHGGVGLGKTHLLHAIGHHIARSKRGAKVAYLRSETFTNEFIQAIQTNSLVKFRKRYRQADVLLIDDIQFLAGKERSQEEFFHTFNSLFEGRKQIVLSSDQPPTWRRGWPFSVKRPTASRLPSPPMCSSIWRIASNPTSAASRVRSCVWPLSPR